MSLLQNDSIPKKYLIEEPGTGGREGGVVTRDPGRLHPLVEEAGALVPGVEVAVGLVRAPPPRPARAAVAPVVAPHVAVAERCTARYVRHGALVVVRHAGPWGARGRGCGRSQFPERGRSRSQAPSRGRGRGRRHG